MNFYETMYIVHPALQAGRLEDIVDNINTRIDTLKGKRIYIDNLGKKKLSYAIDKQKYGTYILIQFEMDGDGVQELSNEFEHNANILRYLINRIEESDVLEQKEIVSETKETVRKEPDNKEKKSDEKSEETENTSDEKQVEDNVKENNSDGEKVDDDIKENDATDDKSEDDEQQEESKETKE